MTHPLTDEIIRKNFTPDYDYFEGLEGEICLGFSDDDLRAAYDKGAADRLEQCIAWLENLHPKYTLAKHSTLANMMKEAMRPQENNQ